MTTHDQLDSLLGFFKALGEPHRLRIVGLLTHRPYTVEDLAKTLGLGVSTVSHHLSRLADAKLVTARAESYYNLYALNTDVLTAMAQSLLKQAEQPRLESERDLDTFDRKVLATFTEPDGRITAFPVQEKKFIVLLKHVLGAFEPGIRYPEKRVNQILGRYSDDTARLRRGLVDHKFMAREGGGGKYWRLDR
jgi:hypothetical protein